MTSSQHSPDLAARVRAGLLGCGLLLVGACSLRDPGVIADADVGATRGVAVVVTADARSAFAAGVDAYRQGANDQALAHFLAAAEVMPGQAAPHLNAGLVLAGLGRVQEAAAQLDLAIAAAPANCDAQVARGLLARRSGDFSVAEAAYNACLANEPAHAGALRNLGVLYEIYLRDAERALLAYRACLAASPGGDAEVAAWIAHLEGQATASSAGQQPAVAGLNQRLNR